MKAKSLKQLLNNTGYTVHFRQGKICVGSNLCSELFSVDIKKNKIVYALDTFNEGRSALEGRSNKDLIFIYDTLTSLLKSGQINNYIEGKDELVDPFPVYSVKDGILTKQLAENIGYPNVTDDGEMMYDNSHFRTEKEALENAIEQDEYDRNSLKGIISEREKEILSLKDYLSKKESNIKLYKKMLVDILPRINSWD